MCFLLFLYLKNFLAKKKIIIKNSFRMIFILFSFFFEHEHPSCLQIFQSVFIVALKKTFYENVRFHKHK